jgi:hypothetical protein
MFPNVRLMVAATFASIVALSLAFGVMATFFVSHEPRGLMTSHGAPLQLSVDAAAPALGETFGSRFQLNVTQTDNAAPRDRLENLASLTPVVTLKSDGGAGDSDTVTPGPPAAEPATPSDAGATEPATVSSIDPPREADPAAQAAAGAEADLPPQLSMLEPAPATKTEENPEESKDAATVVGDPPPAAATTMVETEQTNDAHPTEPNLTEPNLTEPSLTEPSLTEPSLTETDAPQPEIAPAAAEKPAARKAGHKSAAKSESRQHVAGKVHRFRRARPVTEASDQTYYQFTQPNFQTAPIQQQAMRGRVTRTSGIGGPFVRPPAQ